VLQVDWSDLVTILLLIALEGALSADNAMVLAVRVLGLPKHQQQKALRYGMLSAFTMRAIATALAAQLISMGWVKIVGAAYLLWLPYSHFFRGEADGKSTIQPATPWLGMNPFWATVVKVELTDIVFAIDSILVAVAMSPKTWVIVAGGILGIVMMRLLIGQLLPLIRKYPPLVDGAFLIIAWVAVKLLLEYAHAEEWIHFAVPKWLSLGLIVVIMGGAYLYARKKGAVENIDEEAEALIMGKAGD